jgi:hypothetical protein
MSLYLGHVNARLCRGDAGNVLVSPAMSTLLGTRLIVDVGGRPGGKGGLPGAPGKRGEAGGMGHGSTYCSGGHGGEYGLPGDQGVEGKSGDDGHAAKIVTLR